MEILDQGRQPARMVVMGVGQDHHVHFADRAPPEIRRDNILPDVELRFSMLSETQNPAAIHNHQLAVRKGDQQAVPCPTSMAVSSNCRGKICGGKGCQNSRMNNATTAATDSQRQRSDRVIENARTTSEAEN